MSSYFNPRFSYDRPNWSNLPAKINFYKQLYPKQLPDHLITPMLQECFGRRDIVPSKEQLYAITNQLQGTTFLQDFAFLLEEAAKKKRFGLTNVFAEFMKSDQWSAAYGRVLKLMTSGDEAVNKLIALLKNPTKDFSEKASEMARILQSHVASETQLYAILKEIKGTHLVPLYIHTLSQLPEKLNTNIIDNFLKEPRVQRHLEYSLANKLEKGRGAVILNQISRSNDIFGDMFQDANFERRLNQGLRLNQLSKQDNPIKQTVAWFLDKGEYWRDMRFLADRPLVFLKKLCLPR